MLSRKGTLSRKTRASMRRRQAAQFSGARAAGSGGTRRCSVPNLKPMDATLASGLPCKSDTDLAGKGRTTLGMLQEEQRLSMSAASGNAGSLRTVSFYGATTGDLHSTHSLHLPAPSNGKVAGMAAGSQSATSSLTLYYGSGVHNSTSASAGLASSLTVSGSKVTLQQSLLGKCGGQAQTHLSSFRGSVNVGEATVNGVGGEESGKVRTEAQITASRTVLVWID
ncbi:hypothetical protein ACOMHN_063352 [Nucella lapillus]